MKPYQHLRHLRANPGNDRTRAAQLEPPRRRNKHARHRCIDALNAGNVDDEVLGATLAGLLKGRCNYLFGVLDVHRPDEGHPRYGKVVALVIYQQNRAPRV